MHRSPPPTTRLPALVSIGFLALTTAACTDSLASGYCAETRGIPVIASGAEGSWARDGREARLVELWRAGGLNEGEELVDPASLSASPDGRLAIADFSLSEVIVIDADGTWRGRWARRGDGPGELNMPVATTWARDGTLAVYDLTGSKVLFLRDGEPARPDVGVSREVAGIISLAGELPWAGVQAHGPVLLQPPPRWGSPSGEASPPVVRILRYPPGAEQPDTLLQVPQPAGATVQGLTVPGWPRLTASIGVDGAVAIGGVDARYRITLYDSAGRPLREICRNAGPLPISPEERGAGVADDLAPELVALREAPLPDTLAAYGRIFWGAGGRLWVQRNRTSYFTGDFLGSPGGPYDVFDADGEYLGEVVAPPDVRLQAAAGDTVFGFATGELDETSVIAYRLVVE